MGLYLCIFDEEEEIAGVEVGPYSDFNALRDCIVRSLENGNAGSRYPTFILHSDCDGEWSISECQKLQNELAEIIPALKKYPAIGFSSDWQKAVAKSVGLLPQNALESFIDVDGETLLGRIHGLVNTALKHRLPILLQ